MVSTYTPNINLEEPARGDYVGTWDTPVNANMTLIDLVTAGVAAVSVSAGSVVLAAAQFQCRQITFNSTLLANITVTFPSTFSKAYTLKNLATGSSAFTITCQTTAAGGPVVCVPPGDSCDIQLTSGNIAFLDLARVGTYWDYAGSSVPAWISGCTVPPYLNCDGTTFSSATYPQLATILGSTTLPDFRGRSPHYLNQGTGRLTTAGAGIDGNTNYAAGGSNGVTLGASHIPSITSSGTISVYAEGSSLNTVPGSTSTWSSISVAGGGGFIVPSAASVAVNTERTFSGANSMTYTNSSQAVVGNAAPGAVGGLRLIRAG